MKEIPLTQGKTALVDDEDYDELSRYNWFYGGRGYAVRNVCVHGSVYTMIRMHVVIMGKRDGFVTDHINGKKLDNRRCNLRFATTLQNRHNTQSNVGISRYKGVTWNKQKQKWKAYITCNYTHVFLGYFLTEKEAALKYNVKATELYGEYARLNVIK